MFDYQIFTDATSDISREMTFGLPQPEIIPMPVEIKGKAYSYGPNGNLSIRDFYRMQREGFFATTSQINPIVYQQHFEPCLREGRDILYLCLSSGLTKSIESAEHCVNELREKYPDRQILCIDTLCASVGEGFLVCEALRKQAEGFSLQDLANWVTEHRMQVCHWFTVDIFDHLLHGGRISSTTASIGSLFRIKPLLHVNEIGKLVVSEKLRGRDRAIQAQLARMEAGWMPEISNLVAIGHGDCPEGLKQLEEGILNQFPEANLIHTEIGPVIGAHTGPGMLVVIYWGNNR